MTGISAKILGVIVFVLVPSLALRTIRPVRRWQVTQVSARGPWLGSGANGSDGNGSITPSRGEFDAHHTTAPSSKPPIAFRGQRPDVAD